MALAPSELASGGEGHALGGFLSDPLCSALAHGAGHLGGDKDSRVHSSRELDDPSLCRARMRQGLAAG